MTRAASITTTAATASPLPPSLTDPDEEDEQGGHDRAPGDGRQSDEGQPREQCDPRDASEDVEAIGIERLEMREGASGRLPEPRHHEDDQHEDHREAHPLRQRVVPGDALELVGALQGDELYGEGEGKGHQQRQGHRGEAEQVPGRTGRKKPTPMPRKLAKSTKLVMLARCTLLAAVHRMSASSTKSISRLRLTSRHGLCSDVKMPSLASR